MAAGASAPTGIGSSGTLDAAAFHAGTAAADANDRIIYNSATGEIFYDSDGTGAAAQVLFATVTAGTNLTAANFEAYFLQGQAAVPDDTLASLPQTDDLHALGSELFIL